MATSPPTSPAMQRPMSVMVRPTRSSSRVSVSSRHGGGSRSSDEDGKTAVKVAVRVRPPLKPNDPGFDLVPHRFRGSTCQATSPTSLTVESAHGKKLFVFDKVFGEEVDQDGVWEYLSESVNSFVLGYNVSILAYGQSGAGKSYTMGTTGPAEQNDSRLMGVVPRAARVLFEKLIGPSAKSGIRSPNRYSTNGINALQNFSKHQNDKNWQMKATYVEIYQEQLRDLLLDESVPPMERPQVSIREDAKGRILLTGLKQVPINSVEDLLNALNFGSSIRQTDATAVNARSSRSHAVFSLSLLQKKSPIRTATREKRRSVPLEALSGSENWVTVDSKLHFVDLAGSERLKNTGAQGERAREGISINAGLASLGKVISQLSSRQPGTHVSYRDSRLTRLLQDSLGGNAITYMIACVNPVEFHLSETLNTVQYAQRARAIQIKPQIQHVTDDSDKQAVIERLRAEVSFLRDQIRLSERAERRNQAPQERAERNHEREIEMNNQLLDIQENYNALSQRHAKLISEITKARNNENSEETPVLKDAIGISALERLKRSTSFAEAVEQVVLEYEKTIQSLEASLSNTRSSLSNNESMLLEKETKIAYMETMSQQLQARLQKAMDRESNDEHYLCELESRVAGASTDEEKSNAMITSLRKELARVRESESSCEHYISTLEERLAESEQQHEIMAREIDRLEHVVERQRSINKLDNLLYELDNIRQIDSGAAPQTNGHAKKESDSFHSFTGSEHPEGIPEEDEKKQPTKKSVVSDANAVGGAAEDYVTAKEDEVHSTTPISITVASKAIDDPASPAQSRFVNDKLESITQELFDLRVDHEATVNDYDELQRKYQVALTSLAELQDTVEDARRGNLSVSRPSSFVAERKSEDGPQQSSRNLSAELNSVGESLPTDAEAKDRELTSAVSVEHSQREELLQQEMEKLRKLHAEKEGHVTELTENYVQLQEKHQDTLDYVEELKAEVQKASITGRSSPQQHMLRRKSERASVLSDRANRSFAAIRNMAFDNFEDQPDKIQVFEINLNAAMAEFHSRSERVQQLEGELSTLRKEMESKMTIISGLTRERTSMTSTLDMSALSTMREELMKTENQMAKLSMSHAVREHALMEEIDQLKTMLDDAHKAPTRELTDAGSEKSGSRDLGKPAGAEQSKEVEQLQREVADWRSKHDSAMESMKASEKQYLATISDLETSLKTVEQQSNTSRSVSPEEKPEVNELTAQRKRHEEAVASMRKEVEEHKTTAIDNAKRLAELEQSHAKILNQVEEESRSRELTEKELETHRGLVSNLESQVTEHQATVAAHQETLNSLRESHSKEIEELKAASEKAQKEADDKLAATQADLEATRSATGESQASLEAEVAKSKEVMGSLIADAGLILNRPTDINNLTAHMQALVNARKDIGALHETATSELQAVRQELIAANASAAEFERKFGELQTVNDETLKDLQQINEKEQKSSRLLHELEEQLNSNYDQTQAANNRLSALRTERQVHLEETMQAKTEIEKELEESRAKVTQLEAQLAEASRATGRESADPRESELQRSNSGGNSSNPRKSVPAANLPSPPPAIPLPPLPHGSVGASGQSPPTSRHQSKDIAAAQLVEDQEARIRTIEKHLFAEKQLTATLEEALTDLESSSTKMKSDMEHYRRKCTTLEEELQQLRREKQDSRLSVQQMEDEARRRIDQERMKLEERMAQLNNMNKRQKNKRGTINCF